MERPSSRLIVCPACHGHPPCSQCNGAGFVIAGDQLRTEARVAGRPVAQVRAADDELIPAGHRHVGDYAALLVTYMTFFGLAAFVAGSTFPLELGLLLFFADDEFIVWLLGRIGIRLTPFGFGGYLVSALVWLGGSFALLTRWKDLSPGWLVPFAPGSPRAAITAAACVAVLATLSAAIVRKALPRFGMDYAPASFRWLIAWSVTGAVLFALFAGGVAAWDWFSTR